MVITLAKARVANLVSPTGQVYGQNVKRIVNSTNGRALTYWWGAYARAFVLKAIRHGA